MTTCDRCGIDFDRAGPLCQDCIDVLELDGVQTAPPRARGVHVGWGKVRSNRRGTLPPDERLRIEEQIRRMNGAGCSDVEIAIETGLSDRTIWRYRQRLGIPAAPTHAWTSVGGQRAPALPHAFRNLEVA